MSIKVSIITVCYNSEKTIERTIESVLAQTYTNYEYIIVDGASTDNTLDIVQKYKTRFGDKLRVISEPDNGIYYAMNKGIAASSGELIGMINSDDKYSQDAVEVMVNEYCRLKEENVDSKYVILYGKVRIVDAAGDILAIGDSDHNKLKEEMIPHPTCFVSIDTYRDLGIYNTEYISASDYDFMLRMYESGEVRFERVDRIIADFTIGGMCSGSAAYYDLLKVRKAHRLMTMTQYYAEYYKCRAYDFAHRHCSR